MLLKARILLIFFNKKKKKNFILYWIKSVKNRKEIKVRESIIAINTFIDFLLAKKLYELY